MADGFGAGAATNTAALLEQAAEHFFAERRILPDDATIIRNLAEVVKEQQTEEMYGPRRAARVIRLDHSPTQLWSHTELRRAARSRSGALTSPFKRRSSRPGLLQPGNGSPSSSAAGAGMVAGMAGAAQSPRRRSRRGSSFTGPSTSTASRRLSMGAGPLSE